MAMTRTAPGHRTVAAPMRRQPRVRPMLLGSSTLPNRVTIEMSAGPRVSAAATTIVMPIDSGMPMVWKYGSRVKCRHSVAPAIVRPDASTTCAVP